MTRSAVAQICQSLHTGFVELGLMAAKCREELHEWAFGKHANRDGNQKPGKGALFEQAR